MVIESAAVFRVRRSVDDTQPAFVRQAQDDASHPHQPVSKPGRGCLRGCLLLAAVAALVLCLLSGGGLLLSSRTNILLLGLDRAPEGTDVARSDTMILTTVVPLDPYVGMLSIPRDLWVTVPGVSENRINTAHFFAESSVPGGGPEAAMETVRLNFGVDVHYYVRLRFSGLESFVDALGGVPVSLDQPTGTLPAGDHVLDGKAALAFVRDRRGSDDFFRMARTQQFLKASLRRMLDPRAWPRLPLALGALWRAVDTDLLPWTWPRLILAVLRVGPQGVDARVIDRGMVRGFTAASGAQVLAPDWAAINPLLMEMFGQ